MKGKNKRVMMIVLVVTIIIIALLIGYLIWKNQEKTPSLSPQNPVPEVTYPKEVELDAIEVTKIENTFGTSLFYLPEVEDMNQLPDVAKLAIVLNGAKADVASDSEMCYSKAAIERNLQMAFGSNVTFDFEHYQKAEFANLLVSFASLAYYQKEQQSICLPITGTTGYLYPTVAWRWEKAVEEEEQITYFLRVIFYQDGNISKDAVGNVKIGNYVDGDGGRVILDDQTEESLLSQSDIYQYTFHKESYPKLLRVAIEK